jgi:hypothetical protein
LKGRQEAAFTGLEDEVQFNEWEDTLDKVGEIELPVLPRPETSEENKARKKREKHEAEEAKIRLKERDRKHKLSSTGSKKNIFSMKKNMLEKASSKFSLSSGSAGTSEVDLRLMESRDTMSSRVTRETSIGGSESHSARAPSSLRGRADAQSVFYRDHGARSRKRCKQVGPVQQQDKQDVRSSQGRRNRQSGPMAWTQRLDPAAHRLPVPTGFHFPCAANDCVHGLAPHRRPSLLNSLLAEASVKKVVAGA